MQQEKIEAALAAIFETTTGKYELTPTTRLQEDLGLDSLTRIDFAITAEDAFGVSIPDEVLERFVTVGDVLTFLDQVAQQRPVEFVSTRH